MFGLGRRRGVVWALIALVIFCVHVQRRWRRYETIRDNREKPAAATRTKRKADMPDKTQPEVILAVRARNVEEPAPAKAYAAEKFARLGKFSASLREVDVMLQPEGGQWECEVVMRQDRQPTIVLSMLSGDMNSAIDLALERAERLLVREREKREKGRVSERRRARGGQEQEDE